MSGKARTTCRFLVLLLLTALALLGASGFTSSPQNLTQCSAACIACALDNCEGSSIVNGTVGSSTNYLSFSVSRSSEGPYDAGTRLAERVSVNVSVPGSTGNPKTVSLAWHAPNGATHLDFGDNPPDRQDGDTYYWDNLDLDQDGEATERTVTYSVGMPSSGQGQGRDGSTVWAEFELQYDNHVEGVTSHYDVIDPSAPQSHSERAPAIEAPADDGGSDPYLWQIGFCVDSSEPAAITETEWSEWLAKAPDGTPFFGLRFPLGASGAYTDTYPLPVLFDGEHDPMIELVSYAQGSAVVASQRLVYRPEFVPLLANSMGDGHWVALGMAQDADMSPPAGLDVPAGEWEICLSIWLGLRGSRQELVDHTIELYAGFQGDGVTLSAPQAKAADLALSVSGAHLYQGQGTTVIGPWSMRLRPMYDREDAPDPSVQLSYVASAVVAPGERVSVVHSISNLTEGPLDVQLSVETDLGSVVGLYRGSYWEPDLPLTPITSPLPLDATDEVEVWLIGEMPLAAQGVEGWRLVAGVDGDARAAEISDVFWVGEWIDPPGETPAPGPAPLDPAMSVMLPVVTQ